MTSSTLEPAPTVPRRAPLAADSAGSPIPPDDEARQRRVDVEVHHPVGAFLDCTGEPVQRGLDVSQRGVNHVAVDERAVIKPRTLSGSLTCRETSIW